MRPILVLWRENWFNILLIDIRLDIFYSVWAKMTYESNRKIIIQEVMQEPHGKIYYFSNSNKEIDNFNKQCPRQIC